MQGSSTIIMCHDRRHAGRALKWLGMVFCCLVVGNCCLGACLEGPRVRRFHNGSEFANTGTALLFLWTRSGQGSIAWDCLPGLIPECKLTDRMVFVVFPLWIPFIPIALLIAILFWRTRNHRTRK